jgi:hypothetical protein
VSQPQATKVLARTVWESLPEGKRGARRVSALLAKDGIKVPPSSVDRWIKEWTGSPKQWKSAGSAAAAVVEKIPPKKVEPPADLQQVPSELRNILPAHIMRMAKGQGLDRVENAIGIIAKKLEDQAATLVEDQEKFDTAIKGLAVFAGALQTIAQARAVVSIAHRNFAEGDRLRAEALQLEAAADKLSAEADDIRRGCPEDAQVISPSRPGEVPASPIDEAIQAFRRHSRPVNGQPS